MKHGIRPTKKQKMLLKSKGLVPANWLVIKDTPEVIEFVNRSSGKTRKFENC